jgi:hypothetical protein
MLVVVLHASAVRAYFGLWCTAVSVFRAATAVGPACQGLSPDGASPAMARAGRLASGGSSGTASGCCICMHAWTMHVCTHATMQASCRVPTYRYSGVSTLSLSLCCACGAGA